MKREALNDWTTILHEIVEKTVPERKDEIRALWDLYRPALEEVKDGTGVVLEADAHGIRFARKDLQLLWLLGFSGWKAVELYSPSIVLAALNNDMVISVLKGDAGASALERDYFTRLRVVETSVADRTLDENQWPPDIIKPVIERKELTNDQDRMMWDVVNYAMAGLFLHELRHVKFRQDKDGPAAGYEEEMQCDVFARDMMTAKLAAYAASAGHDYAVVLSKRSFGLALMALYLNVITPAYERQGSKDYPPLGDRMIALVETAALDENDHFWMFVAATLLAEARRTYRDLSTLGAGLSFAALARELALVLNPPEEAHV